MTQITPDQPEFAVALRGYDRIQVDEYVSRLNEWARDWQERVREAESASQAAARQVEELSARLDALGVEDPESGPRSIKALGERVGSILQEAHAAAEELRSQAMADAEAVRAEAATELDRLRLESEELRAEAAAEVDRLRAEAEEMRTNGLGVAQAEAASMRAGARQEAEEIVREANAEAGGILEAARTEAERITSVAQSELRSLVERRDSVVRHLADLHRQLAGVLGGSAEYITGFVDLRDAMDGNGAGDRAGADGDGVHGHGSGERPNDITIMMPSISS